MGTSTDWSTARFTVDDSGVVAEVEKRGQTLFVIDSLLSAAKLDLEPVKRDQAQVAARPEQDLYVQVASDARRVFIRKGANQNKGSVLRDCFVLRRDGAIEGPVDWDFASYTRVSARPIDPEILEVKGGVFTTFANRMLSDQGYHYWGRNIVVRRSNTVIDGLTHYVVGEISIGAPYGGFLTASSCANVTFRNCFATGHRTYSTIGSAGRPVSMGTYDYSANSVVNFRMENCRMNLINDRTLWGGDRDELLQEHRARGLRAVADGLAPGRVGRIHDPPDRAGHGGPQRHRPGGCSRSRIRPSTEAPSSPCAATTAAPGRER